MSAAPADGLVHALLYTRVSTVDQARDGLSLGEQVNATRAYVAGKDGWLIAGEYQDVQSGTKPTRTNYQRMKHELQTLKIQRRRAAVVVKFQDRLGRDMPEASKAYAELAKLGVEVHVTFSGGVPGELDYYFRALIAQEESRAIGRRVRENFSHLQRLGWHKPGPPAWGYRLRPATIEERADGSARNVLDVDEAVAPYVSSAWARLAAGESMRAVAMWVQGLPREVLGVRKAGTSTGPPTPRNLGYNAVRKLLRAPVYVARHGAYDDDDPDAVLLRPLGRWPRLVDDDTWRRVTSRRALGRKMPRQASGEYPLTGLLRCSRCGSRMSGRLKGTQGGARAPRREYICHAGLTLGAGNAGRRCLMTVRADVIERPVLDALDVMLAAASEAAALRTELGALQREVDRQERAEEGEPVGRRVAALEAARTKELDRMHAVTTMRADGEIDAEAYANSTRAYRDELERIAAELTRLRGRGAAPEPLPLRALLSSCPVWGRALRGDDDGATRETLAVLLEAVAPVRVARGAYEPNYVWTPIGRAVLASAVWGLRRTARSEAARETLEEARETLDALVLLDHLASVGWSTLTKSRAAEPLARPA